jgi:hypothetical protein
LAPDVVNKCLESLKEFEQYRSQVGDVKNNAGPMVIIERMKLLLKPYNALRLAESSILPVAKQLAAEPPHVRVVYFFGFFDFYDAESELSPNGVLELCH